MIETGSPDPVRGGEGDRGGSWPRWPRVLAWPFRLLVLIALMFGGFMIFELVWPRDDGVEWVDNLVNATALVLSIAAGGAVAARRYGAGALEQEKPTHWRALGIFMLTMALVAVAIMQLGGLLT